jgi:anaerobic selenocysteine-containing dehydrogenase
VLGVDVPLTLIPRRQLRRENAREFRPGETAQLLINPIDAATLHINDGDQVTVSGTPGRSDASDLSTLTVNARVTDRIVPGAVSIPHGYATTNVNTLIDAQIIDPLSGMPHLSGSNVYVRLSR